MRPHDRGCTSWEVYLPLPWAESSNHRSGCNVRKAIALYCGLITQGAGCVISSAAGREVAITARRSCRLGLQAGPWRAAASVRLCAVDAVWRRACSCCASTPNLLLYVAAPFPIRMLRRQTAERNLTYHRNLSVCASVSGLCLRTLAGASPLAATPSFSQQLPSCETS